MDSYSETVQQSLLAVLAALEPAGGASVVARNADGALVERARAGALTALAHLPPMGEDEVGETHLQEGLGSGWTVVNAGI